jgi:hypothetical protein
VIAETNELPTKYAKMVVTDDQGRYVIPDLPTANYNVWVRGYGLIDSPKLRAKPGQHLDIKAVAAPNEAEGDADFMLGPPSADGIDSYVLGEINVSSMFPIPDEAPAEIARCVADRLRAKI